MAKNGHVDAVAIGLTMELPEDVQAKHAVGTWTAAKLAADYVDESGQRWVHLAMPIGDPGRVQRKDAIHAVAVVRQADGYSTVRLELPLKVAGQYAAETTDPEHRGFAIDQAQRWIDEAAG